jgi:hypothetical protein
LHPHGRLSTPVDQLRQVHADRTSIRADAARVRADPWIHPLGNFITDAIVRTTQWPLFDCPSVRPSSIVRMTTLTISSES